MFLLYFLNYFHPNLFKHNFICYILHINIMHRKAQINAKQIWFQWPNVTFNKQVELISNQKQFDSNDYSLFYSIKQCEHTKAEVGWRGAIAPSGVLCCNAPWSTHAHWWPADSDAVMASSSTRFSTRLLAASVSCGRLNGRFLVVSCRHGGVPQATTWLANRGGAAATLSSWSRRNVVTLTGLPGKV